jgi:hypothetical protein
MKKSELKQLIKNILQEQEVGGRRNMRPAGIARPPQKGGRMRPPQGTSRKQTGGGNIICVCADGTTCSGKFRPAHGDYDCSCCPK